MDLEYSQRIYFRQITYRKQSHGIFLYFPWGGLCKTLLYVVVPFQLEPTTWAGIVSSAYVQRTQSVVIITFFLYCYMQYTWSDIIWQSSCEDLSSSWLHVREDVTFHLPCPYGVFRGRTYDSYSIRCCSIHIPRYMNIVRGLNSILPLNTGQAKRHILPEEQCHQNLDNVRGSLKAFLISTLLTTYFNQCFKWRIKLYVSTRILISFGSH